LIENSIPNNYFAAGASAAGAVSAGAGVAVSAAGAVGATTSGVAGVTVVSAAGATVVSSADGVLAQPAMSKTEAPNNPNVNNFFISPRILEYKKMNYGLNIENYLPFSSKNSSLFEKRLTLSIK
jgi:hypothetical protein